MELVLNKKGALPKVGSLTYRREIKLFEEFLKREGKGKSPVEILDSYFSWRKRKFSPSTFLVSKYALKKALMRGASDPLVRAGIEQYFRELKDPKTKRSVSSHEILSPEEIKEILEKAKPRERLFIEFLWKTGVRVSEMVNIRLKDCRRKGEYVYIRILGKGRKEREVFIPFSLFQEIRNEFQGEEWLFETQEGNPFRRQRVWEYIKKAGRRIGREDIHPHTLRHSFASLLVKKRVDIRAVSRYLGHSSITITSDFYLHNELAPEDVEKVFEEVGA